MNKKKKKKNKKYRTFVYNGKYIRFLLEIKKKKSRTKI